MCKGDLRTTVVHEDQPLANFGQGSYGLFEEAEEKKPRSCQESLRSGFKLLVRIVQQEVSKAAFIAKRRPAQSANARTKTNTKAAFLGDKERSHVPVTSIDFSSLECIARESKTQEEAIKLPERRMKKVSFAALGGITIIEVEEHKEAPQFGTGCTANRVISCNLCDVRFLRSGGNIFRIDKSTWLCCHCSLKVVSREEAMAKLVPIESVEDAEFGDAALGLQISGEAEDAQKEADDSALATLLGNR